MFRGAIERLLDLGVIPDIPQQPHNGNEPLPFLFRGENDPSRLKTKLPLSPNSGAMGSFGVFFGDNALCVPETSIYYVTPTHQVGRTWVNFPSEEANQLLAEICDRLHLNIRSITGGVAATEELFKRIPIYQPLQGIFTTPNQVPLELIDYILVDRKTYSTHIDSIDPTLKPKVVPFDQVA